MSAINQDDPQLVEGYSQYKKAELKKFYGIYVTLQEKLSQAKVVVKPVNKKVKPLAELVSKVKYQKEFKELGIFSDKPTNIVGASELWIYNTKYKKLQRYVAAENTTLSVKGAVLVNFDTVKSTQKSCRPVSVAVLKDAGKRVFGQVFAEIKTPSTATSGRMTEESLILAAFK